MKKREFSKIDIEARKNQILNRLDEIEKEGVTDSEMGTNEFSTDTRYQEYLRLRRELDEIDKQMF